MVGERFPWHRLVGVSIRGSAECDAGMPRGANRIVRTNNFICCRQGMPFACDRSVVLCDMSFPADLGSFPPGCVFVRDLFARKTLPFEGGLHRRSPPCPDTASKRVERHRAGGGRIVVEGSGMHPPSIVKITRFTYVGSCFRLANFLPAERR